MGVNNRPNIFDYATKELSQDAMVCWLLKCCHSESERYKNIGYDFVRFILGDDYAAETDIELEKNSPYAQYYHMDVYANVRVGDKIIPIIFEDKTNTFLHGSQEKRYTDMVGGWKNDKKWTNELFDNDKLKWSENTWYVFFKTGYVFNWQKDEIERIKAGINAKVKTVFIDDMIEFVSMYKNDDALLCDYYEYLLKQKEWNLTGNACKCDGYYKKIFGGNVWFEYSYQQWGSKNFAYIDSKKEVNRIYFTIRTGWKKNKDKYSYYIGFMQYRNEKKLYGNQLRKEELLNQRYIITNEIKDISKKIAEKLGRKIKIENNTTNRMPDQNFIFRESIDENNENDVCEFFGKFINEFNAAVTEKYKTQYIIY